MARQMELGATLRSSLIAIALALTLAGEANAQSSGNGLSNFFGLFSGQKSDAPAQPPQAAPANTGSVQWSGEDGASGHPLMTAAAIREAAGNFDTCVAAMWPDAARRNITQENFQRFTAGLTARLKRPDQSCFFLAIPKKWTMQVKNVYLIQPYTPSC